MEIYFATSNDNKFKEAQAIFLQNFSSRASAVSTTSTASASTTTSLRAHGHYQSQIEYEVQLKRLVFNHNEIRSDDLKEIAEEAVLAAYSKIRKPVFVEDTGLFIDSLNGFPGTYSGWVQKKIGNAGILTLLKEKDRSARFETVCAFAQDKKNVVFFRGICNGKIAEKPRGESGFGYDPIFIPEGYSETFAENIELKNKLSHRYKSLQLLIDYLKDNIDILS